MSTRSFSCKAKTARRFETLLYALVFSLVFEGLLRKAVPALEMPLFLLKDALCLFALMLLAQVKLTGVGARLKAVWTVLLFLLLPSLFFTAFKDVALAFFAAKQYLLYVVTGLVAVMAFPHFRQERFRWFLFFAASLLVPTTMVAVLQNSLPPSHWLNQSVGGGSLENFAAAGFLRVGSTFSFTAQYSWFLNAQAFLLAASFFLPPVFRSPVLRQSKRFIYLLLGLMLALSVFITGGRTAVIGCAGTLALGMIFISIKQPGWLFSKGLALVVVCAAGLIGLRTVKPEYFAAYDQRSAGTEDVTHNREITSRLAGGFTDWTEWFWHQEGAAVAAGNGLGVMSNGAERISAYAAHVRSTGVWPESDFPTTLWEGGIYLALVWYGFRLALIVLCYRFWRRIKTKALASAASVALAYVVIHGLVDAFGMQPPLSIWWWLAIGTVACIYQTERHRRIVSYERRKALRLTTVIHSNLPAPEPFLLN